MVALGIANMMIKEGLYNKDFVANHTFGFEGWTDGNGKSRLGFKEFVLAEYEVNAISKKTGVPVDTFIRLAREFASNQPSLAIGFRDRPFHQMAVSVLNGLAGNIEAPGGVLIPGAVPFQPFPSFKRDAHAQKGVDMERIDGGKKSANDASSTLFLRQECALGKTLQAQGPLPLLHQSSLFQPQP